jgi:competence protein ComEC
MEKIMKNNSSKIIFITVIFILNVFVWKEIIVTDQGSNILIVRFLAVGQGDAILIDDSHGNQILIDGGDGKKILEKLDKYLPFYDRTIEMIVLTHPDFDHLGGILKALESYEVENFLYSGIVSKDKSYQEFINLLEREKLKIIPAQTGQGVILANGASLNILYPDEAVNGIEVENANEYSVVTKLIFNDFSLLLPSDAGRRLEAHLLNSDLNLKSDILKIGHHGSKYSTHPLFFIRTNPEIAVISVGENRYGHPTQEVLNILKNILTLRTDLSGDVTIKTDGKKMQILTEK